MSHKTKKYTIVVSNSRKYCIYQNECK